MPPLPQAANAGAAATNSESPRTRLRRLKVTRDDIHDPLRHHDHSCHRPSVQSARDGLQLERRRFDFVLVGGASDHKLISPLAIYLYGNGNRIVNEQARLYLRPRLIGEQGVVFE